MAQNETKNNVRGKPQPKLAAKSYEILKVLYPDKQISITDVAKKIGDSPGNVSRTLKSLKNDDLIIIRETSGETKGGRPKKICSLTNKGRQIVEIFKENLKPSLTEDQISTLIILMEDKTLSPKTNEVAAETLSSHATSISESLIKNQKIKDIFKQAVSNSLSNGAEIEKSTRSLLSATLKYIIENDVTANWFYENLYDDFLKIAQDSKLTKPQRIFAINILSRTARLSNQPAITSRTINALINLYFNNTGDAEEIENELANEPKLQIEIINKIKQHTKIEDQKTAAEELLQKLVKNWWNNDLSRHTAST
jgi:DNA-binding PadR family transcriptional regulator